MFYVRSYIDIMTSNINKFGKKSCPSVVYLDNNGTTLVCQPAKKIHAEWLSCYNPSSDSKIAKPAKKVLEKAIDAILAHCGVSTATHTAVFTSGGTESNCFIIKACCRAYKKKLIERGSEMLPHIIVSAIEHHSIMQCVSDLVEAGEIDVSYVQPTIYGNIMPADVEKEIKNNTCLISIMYANNEIPVINNIKEIGEVAHKNRIPLHSDCVQIFGKYKIDIVRDNIDALSAAGHKFYAPKGIGLLILNNTLIEGYGLTAEISGTQQHGLRGGTENIAGIASMLTALKWAFVNRKNKNLKLYALRTRLLEKLAKHYKFANYADYVYEETKEGGKPKKTSVLGVKTDKAREKTKLDSDIDDKKKNLELISLGPPEDKKGFILPNTVLISVCKNKGRPFCNIELKKFLDGRGYVISIGSACHTNSEKASHVLTAIGAPPVVKRGVIRISFGDFNTASEVDKFVSVLRQGIEKQCSDLNE
jgi:cysteine desulfurase